MCGGSGASVVSFVLSWPLGVAGSQLRTNNHEQVSGFLEVTGRLPGVLST